MSPRRGRSLPLRRRPCGGMNAVMKRTICLLAVLISGACAEPLELADWTIPVPEGARIIEYDDPGIEDRDGRIELVEDLVVGPRGEDPNYLFFRPQGVAVDGGGRMYVLEMGSNRVQVFSPEGEYLRTLGQQGQGPGELQMPIAITASGDRIVVSDWRNLRLSHWDAEGIHLGDVPMASGRLEQTIVLTGSGSYVSARDRRLEDGSGVIDVTLFSAEGTETVRYASLPEPNPVRIEIPGGGGVVIPALAGSPAFTASPSGEVYATAGQEYQVLAFDASGSPRWALRAARRRQAFTDEHKSTVVAPLRERFPELNASEAEWPAFLNTIAGLSVDGHGHLYTFPYFFRGMAPDESPVEVYSPEGERLFAGTINERAWSAASGDYVYSLRTNEQTDEAELVRYRLIEPFDP